MSDDIDIEEHDVMDNPRIKNIFPDITTIKTEIVEYEDDFEESNTYSDNLDSLVYPHGEETLSYPENDDALVEEHSGVAEISTYPLTSDSTDHQENRKSVEVEYNSEDHKIRNMIVLGSKPCSSDNSDIKDGTQSDSEDEPEILPSSVLLEDWGVILANSPCYCHECKTLFPTQNAIDAHRMIAHSFLVAVSKNTAIKSTSKGSVVHFKNDAQVRRLLCSHCNVQFPDEDSLLKHTYELIPMKFSPKNPRVKTGSNFSYNVCPICSCFFKSLTKLNSHAEIFHNLSHVVPVISPFKGKCKFCSSTLCNPTRYQRHVFKKHTSIFYTKIKYEKYECHDCNLTFPSAYSEKIHRASKHSNIMGSLPKPVQRINLFKCNQCPIHSVYCSTALDHSTHSKLPMEYSKCDECQIFIIVTEHIIHKQQHTFTDKFKIHTASVALIERIICTCLTCNVSFDERTFINSHSSRCVETKAVTCHTCLLQVNENCITKHTQLHKTLKPSNFILTYLLCSKWKSSEEIIDMVFCDHCKCYARKNHQEKVYHKSKECHNKEKIICKFCGLTFTKQSMIIHKLDHQRHNYLRLRHFDVYDLQTQEQINPPFPEFNSCQQCHVHFFSEVALSRHTCASDDFRSCGYCEKKFSDLALKLHIPFHEYSRSSDKESTDMDDTKIPELLKKYESLQSIWHILYVCSTCNVATDNYDNAVEHSQDHLNNISHKQNILHCDVCNLNVYSNCFDKHKILHMNNVQRSSFKILIFHYNKLLSNEWMNVFTSLGEDQVKQILSKSIYNVTRIIRMKLTTDGPSDLTLYKCSICNIIIEPTRIIEHANQIKCQNSFTYCCSVCQFDFLTEDSLTEHNVLHNSRMLTKKSFRIISFNNKDYNTTLLNHLQSDNLKFIRCQHCGKFIFKSLYKTHIAKHMNVKAKLKIKPYKAGKSKLVEKGKTFKPLFKCRKCGVCILRQNIPKHSCSEASAKKWCSECNLTFRITAFKRHSFLHELYGTLKLSVYYFKNGVIEKDEHGSLVKMRRSYKSNKLLGKISVYQCAKCKHIVHTQRNTLRHSCGTRLSQQKCNLCGLSLHSAHMNYHKSLHRAGRFPKKDIAIIQFNLNKTKNKSYDTVSSVNNTNSYQQIQKSAAINKSRLRLYKCQTCLLLFTQRSQLLSHVNTCTGEHNGKKCDICGLNLHITSYNSHIATKACSKNLVTRIFVELDIKSNAENANSWIYCCSTCQLYFMSYKNYFYHIDVNHKVGKVEKCDDCNIKITSRGFKVHVTQHHNHLSLDFSKINVEMLSTTEIEKKSVITNDKKNMKKPQTTTKISNSSRNVLENALKNFSRNNASTRTDTEFTLYQCHICKFNFLQPGALRSHFRRNEHFQKSHVCQVCKLKFTLITFNKHNYIHDQKNPFRVISFEDGIMKEEFYSEDIYKNFTENKSVVDLNNAILRDQPFSSEKVKTVPLSTEISPAMVNNSGNEHISIGNSIKARIFAISSDLSSVQNRKELTEPINRIDFRNKNQFDAELYKCSVCDVYFLTSESCRDHCYNHSMLDPTEYIACKICELQFLCESLGKHMKGHREKTFNLENLIVSEYRPNGNDLKIVTYSAIDALKMSNCVSTTTHSDVEC